MPAQLWPALPLQLYQPQQTRLHQPQQIRLLQLQQLQLHQPAAASTAADTAPPGLLPACLRLLCRASSFREVALHSLTQLLAQLNRGQQQHPLLLLLLLLRHLAPTRQLWYQEP
jgi:hypothetical protein